jgi:hypothetical protein
MSYSYPKKKEKNMVVNYQTLVAALEKLGYTKEVSIDTAERVLEVVGLYGRGSDRNIKKDLRTILYEMEKIKIVTGEMQEAEIPAGDRKGSQFRLYSWVLNEDYIHELTMPVNKHLLKMPLDKEYNIYNDEKMWEAAK